MGLRLGKLPPQILNRHVLMMTGAESRDLVVAPAIGLDFGVVRIGKSFLIVSSDPVTGIEEGIGEFAVNVSANDVATSGNRPRFMQSVILLPQNASVRQLEKISSSMHKSARSLGITLVGGHTELTPGLERPIVVTTAFTFGNSYVSAAGAKRGDLIMLTKTAGLEGTAILVSERRRDLGITGLRAKRVSREFSRQLSILKEAEAAYKTGFVHAMHDCTEGGVLGAVYEMAYASGLGFRINTDRIPVAKETELICRRLRIDPLRLISSGALLLAVAPTKEQAFRRVLRDIRVPAARIGRFTSGRRLLIHRGGRQEEILEGVTDELWKIKESARSS
jgi:hydrogenase maturation factor